MGTAGKAFEALQAGKKAIKQGRELHGKVQEGYGRAREVHGKAMEVKQQAEKFGIALPKDASSLPKTRTEFQKEAKGYARGCFCGFWGLFKAEAKRYITYVLSLLVFAFIAIGLVCFLIAVLSHHPHLQLFTLTTKTMTSNTKKGDMVATGSESVDYKIYLLHYCVFGLTAKAEEQFKMTNGCHQSKQALYGHVLPALNSTFTPPLPAGPTADIQTLFRKYGYISFSLYIFDIILLPVIAGAFIWWLVSTLTPWKRTFRLVLCFFTATILAPAILQTLLVYRTMHILKHDIDLNTSSLEITLKTGFLYIILTHFFWCTLLFNLILFRLIEWLRNKRKARKLHQTQGIDQAQNIQVFDGSVHDGHNVAGDTLYDTQSFGINKMPLEQESMGIPRSLWA
ncbi:2f15ca9f-1ed4-464e-ac60-58f7476c3b68 [Sclerotinia trifoliorum]|uniref:2f15ca9f-1ed4-464e-ac60-58f7476c3b68 n=1 Tax=Sclerotinia trifoliorum TaxID=28548 RepID=A0A8H2VPB6_9HELO|nr:2f15ca9f-1ed4-464e-ac60-58f7476c3b68 [Sclerotinia trifoliorum]